MEQTVYQVYLDQEKKLIDKFLRDNNLFLEDDVDQTFYIKSQDAIIGTISASKNVIKCFAIDPNLRSGGIGSTLVSHIIQALHQKRIFHYMVFTKSENIDLFMQLGMNLLTKTDKVALLENDSSELRQNIQSIRQKMRPNKKTAALVMNCNPMTNGHLYLIETCAKENEQVVLFLVEEDLSQFPFDMRFRIVTEATKHLENIIVVPSGRYIISLATFPTYFLRKEENIAKEHAKLDITLFKTHFMEPLGISMRYVGEEPYSETTNIYNDAMIDVLKDQVKIIKRIQFKENYISASYVRKALIKGDMELVKQLVPKATWQELISCEGKQIISKLKDSYV